MLHFFFEEFNVTFLTNHTNQMNNFKNSYK